MVSGTTTWESYFSIEVHAPSLSTGNITINDTAGNGNGRLDPGETVVLTIPTENSGSAVSPTATGILTCSNQGLTIENASYEIGEIDAGESLNALFTVTADAGMIIGTPLELVYDAVAGEYSCQANYSIVVGLILEDFESNSFDSFDWEFGGNGNWTISTDAQEGLYSAKSAVISHNQVTSIYLETTVLADGELSFYKKVSSEGNWDYLRFYIDNTEMDSWSGTLGWSQETYNVTAGEHTFKWEYDKDGSVSSGSDCAWIDYIVFPPMATGALGTVSGTITDSATGLTIEGADIAGMTTSGVNGTYTFDMMPGTYSLTISHDDYYDYLAEDVLVEEGAVTTLDVALVPLPDLDPPTNPSAVLQDYNDVFVSWEPPGGAPVALWNQMDNPSTAGISAQDFETSYNQYDAMGADDFIVPAGETWSVFEIDILSFYSDGGGPCDLANVRFYADNGGTPGDLLHEFLDVAANPDETGNLFCTIPDTEFTEGTYWLSVQGRMDYGTGGQWYWTRQMAPAIESEFTTVYGNRNGFVSSKAAKHVTHNQRQGKLSIPNLSAVNEAYIQEPQENTSRSLLGYKIYRNGSVIYDSLDPLTVTYLDVALDAGVYEYEIVAVYDEGDSDPAPAVSATVLLPAPLNAAASMQGTNVFVTWSSPAEARDIDSYNVYRDGVLYSEEVSSTFFIDLATTAGATYIYNITTLYDGGWESEYSNDAEITITGAGGELIPLVTELEGNFPNPFNPTTTIKFGLNEPALVTLEVYNIRGEKVRTLVDSELEAKYHTVHWNGEDGSGKNVSSGVYFYKMKAGSYTSTKKMIMMK
ncbi:MAG: hypothetical protein B1H06_05975 [Candidatus Cloacimonas sp. 4484_143]|nr:MAG: hypothetical protein B1H06_05975 [Candidatus Cloacimonas sp. 4484_143]